MQIGWAGVEGTIFLNRWCGQPGSLWFPMTPAQQPTPICQSCGSMGFALYVNGGPACEATHTHNPGLMLRDIGAPPDR